MHTLDLPTHPQFSIGRIPVVINPLQNSSDVDKARTVIKSTTGQIALVGHELSGYLCHSVGDSARRLVVTTGHWKHSSAEDSTAKNAAVVLAGALHSNFRHSIGPNTNTTHIIETGSLAGSAAIIINITIDALLAMLRGLQIEYSSLFGGVQGMVSDSLFSRADGSVDFGKGIPSQYLRLLGDRLSDIPLNNLVVRASVYHDFATAVQNQN
jgi:hypothetical protein